jgi:F-type H+-transporting ATPase subunit epsilon
MKTFVLELCGMTCSESVPDVVSLVARDASGQFGVLAGRARLVTRLGFGLVRFRTGGADWQYVALPGGVLYFAGGRCTICTRRYLRDADSGRMVAALREDLAAEDERLSSLKQSLQRLEEQMLKRLVELPGGPVP